MKTLLSFFLLITLSNLAIAQTTAIPDVEFEQRLINLGFDTGIPDGTVLTSSIDTVTFLDVSSLPVNFTDIVDLSGIDDFSSLITLYCHYNQLTSLDVTQHPALTGLNCSFNQLTSLDVSQNIVLQSFQCQLNQLTCLNINSSSNNLNYFDARDNPKLSCIDVDNVAYSNSNWSNIDDQTSFSTNGLNLCIVGIGENNLSNISFYPNPTSGSVNID